MTRQTHKVRFEIGRTIVEKLEDLLEDAENHRSRRTCIWPTPKGSGWYIHLDLDDPLHRDSAEWLSQMLTDRLNVDFRLTRPEKNGLERVARKVQAGLRERRMSRREVAS